MLAEASAEAIRRVTSAIGEQSGPMSYLLGEKYIGISVGGEDATLKDGGTIHDTQSSLVLEDLIGKFLLNTVNKDAK